MSKLRIASIAAVLAGCLSTPLAATAADNGAFRYRYLPAEKCTMRIDPSVLGPSDFSPRFKPYKCPYAPAVAEVSACTSHGGEIVDIGGKAYCKTPAQELQKPAPIRPTTGNGPYNPTPQGDALKKPPSGCILRPENPLACAK